MERSNKSELFATLLIPLIARHLLNKKKWLSSSVYNFLDWTASPVMALQNKSLVSWLILERLSNGKNQCSCKPINFDGISLCKDRVFTIDGSMAFFKKVQAVVFAAPFSPKTIIALCTMSGTKQLTNQHKNRVFWFLMLMYFKIFWISPFLRGKHCSFWWLYRSNSILSSSLISHPSSVIFTNFQSSVLKSYQKAFSAFPTRL